LIGPEILEPLNYFFDSFNAHYRGAFIGTPAITAISGTA